MKAKADGPGVLLPLLSALAGASAISPALVLRARQAQSRAERCFPGPGDAEQAHHCAVDEKLVFLHIPKNAGTAIEDLAFAHGVAWGRNADFDSCHIKANRCLAAWHEPPALLPRGNPYSAQAPVFCVVRNPFLRVVSEYKYLHSHPEFQWDNADILQKYGCSDAGLNAWLVRALSRYQSGHSFLQMCHMLPQSFYIWGPPDDQGKQCQYCQEILHTEDLPTAFNALMESYNYSMRWNVSERGNAGGCPDLSVRSLNSTAVEHVLRVYERDFALLNYSTDAGHAEVSAKATGGAGGATGGAGGAAGGAGGATGGGAGQSPQGKQAGKQGTASPSRSSGKPIKVQRHGRQRVGRVVRQRSRPAARRGRRK